MKSRRTADRRVKTFEVLRDDKTLALFRAVAENGKNAAAYMKELKLSRKMFYSRMARLKKANIASGHLTYHVTLYGRVFVSILKTVDKAQACFWQLKVLDNISTNGDIPVNERRKIAESLVIDPEIRKLLFGDDS